MADKKSILNYQSIESILSSQVILKSHPTKHHRTFFENKYNYAEWTDFCFLQHLYSGL